MTILSLRTTIGTISAAAVAIVTAITMTITLTVSFDALRAIGVTHAASLADVARLETTNYVSLPEKQMRSLINATLVSGVGIPQTEGDFSGARFGFLRNDMMRTADFRYSSISLFFVDGASFAAGFSPAQFV